MDFNLKNTPDKRGSYCVELLVGVYLCPESGQPAMNRDARLPSVLRYLLAGLALALFVTSAPSWAVCTAANLNTNVAESTPSADFTDHGNGTVTHAKTGLMWKQCAEGLSDATCGTGAATTMTWSNALAAAESASFAGFTDWRLPNFKELNSIVETCGSNPAINQTLFPATPASYFWSASAFVPNPVLAWVVYFGDGNGSAYTKPNTFYARLVRGGQSFDSFDSQADFTPDDFSFTAQTGVALSTVTPSNTITVAGITTVSPISIVGGTYSINVGAYTAAAGTVNNGDTVTLQQTSSASFSALTTATLTIGGVSGAFDVTTLAGIAAPAAPLFHIARAKSSSRIVLRWWDRSTNETGFSIERKLGSCTSTNPWSEIATVGANVITFTNTDLSARTRYSYRVRAYNAGGNSAYSNCSSAKTKHNHP